MKILITGAAGFIGSTLAENLIDNEIIAIDNFNETYSPKQKRNNIKKIKDKIKLYEVDIRNKEKLEEIFKKEKNIDLCIHLAAAAGVRPSMEKPNFYYEENVIGTLNILEMMKKYKCRKIIYFSSSSVYGDSNKDKFKEEDITEYPISIYAATKKSAEIMLYNYHINYNISTLIIRPFNIYGPKQRPDLVLPIFTKKILNKEEIIIYGDGTTLRDYTYISDLVDAVKKSIDYINNNNTYEIINISSSNPKTINELIEVVKKQTKQEIKIKYKQRQMGDVKKTYGDNTKAYKLLNWTPKTNFEEGIKKYIDWYKENEK